MRNGRTNTGSYLMGWLLNENAVAWLAAFAIVLAPLAALVLP